MPDFELDQQKRNQLDSNIKAMMQQGASQDDVMKYADDFKSKFGKKKDGTGSPNVSTGVSASASAIGSKVTAPDGNPQTQQRINEITQYLQNRNQKPVQDNLVPVQQIKTSVAATASKEKQAQEQAITQQLQQKKKVLSNSTTSGEALQAKYGADWKTKATPKELADYGQGLQDYYDKEKEKGTPMMENIPVDKGQEAIQKAADDLNGTAFGKLFYNVIQPMSKAGGSALSNTAAAVTRYGGRAFGLDEVTEGMADWVNENINPENRWQGTMAGTQPTKLQGNLFNNGKINLAKILPSTVETLTTMAWLTGGGSGSGQLMGRSFALTEQDYRNEGQRHGLKGAALDKFALSSAVLTSALEMISPNRLITGGEKKAFSKMYGKAIAEGFSNSAAIKLAAKEFKSEIVKENVQEISQMAGDKIVRLITDKTSDKPVFADDLSFNGIKDELAETVLMTTLSTGLLQSPNTIKNAKPSNLEKSTWYNVSQNPDQYKTFLNKQIVEGKLNKEQATNAFNFFNKYKTAVDQAKQFGFSPDQQTEAAWQIYKGNDINESVLKLKNNPVLKTAVAPQLKKEQEEVTHNIQRIGMGVPEVGAEITGQDLAQIIGNIGDKGGTGETLQKRVEENTYRVEEINLQELYDNKESFRNNVDNYDRKEDESGLIVPAIMNTEGKIIDGRSRLAQQYKNGQKTAQVFKQLKTEADIEPISEVVEPNKIESAVIEINGKEYEGKNHAEAILKAKADGQDITKVDRNGEGRFKLSDGTIINREEAKKQFGQDRSELLIPQDEAADNANKEYAKITESKNSEIIGESLNVENQPNIRQQTELSADNLQQPNVDNTQHPQAASVENKPQPIRQLGGSPREIIKELKERKGDKAIHAEIFQSNGYNVFIYDNNKILVDKKFKTHEEAKKHLEDWSSENGKDNQSKYDYGTITDIANPPYRQEVTGNLPKDFIENNKAKEQSLPTQEVKDDTPSGIKPSETAETIPEQVQNGEGVVPPPPTGPTEEGFKSEAGKKSLLGRAFEGESSESLKEKIAYYGLNYETQTHDEARATAQQIIKELGITDAIDAVRKNIVQDAEAAMIWAEAIDFIGEQITNETDPDKIAALEKEEASLLNEFDLRARGAGRFISSLNNIYNNSNFGYKLSERISRYKNLNNGEIPAEVEAKYQELDKKYQELLKQIADMQEEQKKQREQQAMDNIKEETERATKREPKKTSTEKAKKIAEIIRKGKIQKPGIFMSSSPVSAIWDAAIEITAKAVEAGGRLSDAIIAGVEYIKQTDWYKNLNKDQQKEAVNSFSAGVNSTVNTEVKKPSINEDGKIIIPPSLIREYVEGGIDNINDLTEAIKQDLLEEYPDVTDRQVRDAITEYGKTINPTQDEVSQQISKMKNIGRIISALEDIEAKKRPLKSGLQRRKYDPEERALQKQLREALKELPADAEARDKQLKTTLEAIKTRLRNSIEDIEREISTGEKRATNKGEVSYDEEAKSLREERDRLREIRDEIFGDEVTEEQRISRALNVTERSVEQLEQKIKDNDLSFKQKQTLDSPELKAARERLKNLRDTINEMREQAGVAEVSRLESAKKRVEKRIAELKTRLANKDFTKKPKRVLAADEALIKLNAEKLFVQEEYAKEEYKAELKNRNLAQKIKDGATEIWGLTRVFMATGELSFIMIQGGLFSITHPKIAINSFAKMLSHMTSEKRFNEWERYVKSQPYYPALKASKLALSEYDSKLTAREELGVSGWANHIWDYTLSPVKLVSKKGYEFLKSVNPLKAIERGGVAYMNNIRLNRFLTGMEKLQLEGKTFTTNPDDYKRMADVINTLSGRASLGKLEPNAQTLALLFFSPRNWASMIKQFPPIFFTRQMYKWRGSDGKISVAQKMAVSDYMKYVTITGGLLLAMAEYFKHDDDDDTEVSFDPTSSDFLKIRNKNTRIDVFGGRTQMMVFTMRMIFDEKTSISGKTSRLGEGMLAPNKRDLIIDMVSNKLAPTAGILNEYVNTRVKKNADGSYTRINKYTGEEYSILTKAAESVQPIFWGTVREIHKDQPAEVAAFLDVMAAIGVNIATYIPKKKKQSADGIIRKGE